MESAVRLTASAEKLLSALTARAGASPAVLEWNVRPWASINFTGSRHRMTLAFDDRAAIARLVDGLDWAEFDIEGEAVIDIVADRRQRHGDGECVVVEALLIEAD